MPGSIRPTRPGEVKGTAALGRRGASRDSPTRMRQVGLTGPAVCGTLRANRPDVGPTLPR